MMNTLHSANYYLSQYVRDYWNNKNFIGSKNCAREHTKSKF